MQESKMTLIINDKVYHLDTAKPQLMGLVPQSVRLQLVRMLKASATNKTTTKKSFQPQKQNTTESVHLVSPQKQNTTENVHLMRPKQQNTQTITTIPKTVKSAAQETSSIDSKDPNVIMQNLIIQQQQSRKAMPEKATIYKWFMIVISVIVLLALIFG